MDIKTGSSIGSALTYPLCGYIIDVFGWEMAFYVCGVLGTTWYIAWYFLVFDSPQQHPRISQREKEQIIESLGKTVSKEEKVCGKFVVVYKIKSVFCLGADSLETPVNFRSCVDEYFGAMGWLVGVFHADDAHAHLF